jgi:hypothetical protein
LRLRLPKSRGKVLQQKREVWLRVLAARHAQCKTLLLSRAKATSGTDMSLTWNLELFYTEAIEQR